MIPEYTLAGVAWLAAALVLAAAAGILHNRRTWLAFGAFLLSTIVFDAVLTGVPVVTYGAEHITGLLLGSTPVEDYLYGQALCLTAIASYELARRGRGAGDGQGRGAGDGRGRGAGDGRGPAAPAEHDSDPGPR